MHTVEIVFPSTKFSEAIDSAVNQLIGCWRNNGQLAGREFPSWMDNDGIHCSSQIPAQNALSLENNSLYADEALSRLADLKAAPVITDKGPCPESDGPCRCAARQSLILYTNFVSMESPARCGDCFRPIPLYTFGAPKDTDYFDVLAWEADYKACDTLQMGCSVGERFGERQLYEHDSPLNRQAGAIARRLEKLTGVPTYTYLMKSRGKTLGAEQRRPCPRCGGAWRMRKPRHDRFDFCCEKCRLIANIAWNVRDTFISTP